MKEKMRTRVCIRITYNVYMLGTQLLLVTALAIYQIKLIQICCPQKSYRNLLTMDSLRPIDHMGIYVSTLLPLGYRHLGMLTHDDILLY